MAPGPGRRHANPHSAAEFGVARRFERRHLLVAGLDELRPVVRTSECGDDSVDSVARVAEDVSDVPLPQPLKQVIGDILGHDFLPIFAPDKPCSAVAAVYPGPGRPNGNTKTFHHRRHGPGGSVRLRAGDRRFSQLAG